MPSIIARLRERLWLVVAPSGVRSEIRAAREALEFMRERGWVPLSPAADQNSILDIEREEAVRQAYYYWTRDPLMSRAVQLIRDYTFGLGVSWTAVAPEIESVLKAYWNNPDNDLVATTLGQWELSERLQLAGEVFLIFFVAANGSVKTRVIEPVEIQDIITSPNDATKRLYYKRIWTKRYFDWKTKGWRTGDTNNASSQIIDFIQDWTNRDGSHSTVNEISPEGSGDGTKVYIMHVKINSHSLRGVTIFLRVLTWISAYKGFMEDRATLTLAAATIAFKQKIVGSSASVSRLARQWGSTTVNRRYQNEERAQAGQVLVENAQSTLEPFRVDTGASAAYTDGRMLRQQVGAGVGITEPDLTSDPSVSNLASMTAMNGPMLKMFESWQQIWRQVYLNIFKFVISQQLEHKRLSPDVDQSVNIVFPPIVTKELPSLLQAISQLVAAQQQANAQYISPRRIAILLLEAFGVSDVDSALKEVGLVQLPQDQMVTVPDETATKITAALEAIRQEYANNGHQNISVLSR